MDPDVTVVVIFILQNAKMKIRKHLDIVQVNS